MGAGAGMAKDSLRWAFQKSCTAVRGRARPSAIVSFSQAAAAADSRTVTSSAFSEAAQPRIEAALNANSTKLAEMITIVAQPRPGRRSFAGAAVSLIGTAPRTGSR
ncbi:hypothetical protein BH11PSE2_BH11PSE2_11320 [soil metagenome]